MSRESLTQLIIDEAQREADQITRDAKATIENIRHEETDRLSENKKKLESEFKKNKAILASSKSARINSMERAEKLKAIHQALDRVKRQSADILLSDSFVRDRLREIALGWKDGSLSVGRRIVDSLPEIIENTSLQVDREAPDYAIIHSIHGISDVIDLVYECGRILDDDADEFVAILTSY